MKLSERSIKRLQEIITGDKLLSPYRSGPQLVAFFNELGTNHVYGQGFPSRWAFTEDCIRHFNGTLQIANIIRSALDPRDYMDKLIYDGKTGQHIPADIEAAVKHLNEFLAYDGYEIVKVGNFYGTRDLRGGQIIFEHKLDQGTLSHSFIAEQIEKCKSKISQGDYDGAITNARSMIEAVLIEIENQYDPNSPDYDGDLSKLYKRVQKHLNLGPDNQDISDNLKQVLRGFVNIINGLSGISNKMGDRHAREYKPSKHHAALVVNSAMTLANFLFDTHIFQSEKK